jgi:hypothetical protein
MNFKIPLQTEIAAFLGTKKPEWPEKFCLWYADKIWLFYDQKGWMVGKNKMQNWKSAVSLHFLTLSDSNQAELNKYKVIKIRPEIVSNSTIEGIELLYQQYVAHPTHIMEGILAGAYDTMKEQGLIKLTPEQKKICISLGPTKGRAQAVRYTFENRALNKKLG